MSRFMFIAIRMIIINVMRKANVCFYSFIKVLIDDSNCNNKQFEFYFALHVQQSESNERIKKKLFHFE